MPSHTVRVLCEARSQSRSVRDAATGEVPFFWRGSSVVMQLGLADNGQHLLEAGVGTIIVEVKALSALSVDDSLMRKEFLAAACDDTFVAADWAGGAKQLLAASFTLAEAAIAAGTYRLIVRHIAPDDSEMTYLSAELRVVDPQAGSEGIDAPPVAWSYLEALPVVRVDIDQSLTAPEKARGLRNLGVNGFPDLNVADYGLPLDGTSLCNTAFEDCFTDGLARGIKTINVPAGNFVLNTLVIPPGFHLIGAAPSGATAWTLATVPANLTRFITQNASSDVLKCETIRSTVIENIEIEHVSASVTSTGYGIRIENATPGVWPGAPFRLINCTIRNFARGLYNDSGNRIHIEGSHLVQNDYGYYSTGVTSTLSCFNSELGGVPKDGGNGQAWYVTNAQGAVFGGCEFGNCYRVGNVEGSSVVEMTGCNFESVSGPYGIGITTGRLVLTASSCASVAAPFVRNTGTQAGLVTINGFTIRSGGNVIFDGRAVGYETSVDGDFPVCINTAIACRRTTSDFSTTKEYWSGDRNPLPFGESCEIQRIELSGTVSSATAASGGLYASPLGVDLYTTTAVGSTVVANLSEGNVYAPVLARIGDSSISTFDWSRRLVIRFNLQTYDQGSSPTSDNQAAILFGVPYNRLTSGALAAKGIGIQIVNGAITAVVHDGSTGTSVAVGSIADATKKQVVLDYDGAGTLKVSLTGHYDVTRSGGPTGLSTAHNNSILLAAWNTTGGSSIPHYSISDLEIAYY